MIATTRQPRSPVLDWGSFRQTGASRARPASSVHDLPAVIPTTSGRAAIYHALRQLDLPGGSQVLVPTYHCPTMVAPVVAAGLQPRFFGLRSDGLPQLGALQDASLGRVGAIVVAHYFGIGRSLAEVREWCDARNIALIEDCAHCLFGTAGELPVGEWGDYATASLAKFLPVPEGGLLGSSRRPLRRLDLKAPGLTKQLKSLVDVIEYSAEHRRLRGISDLASPLLWLKNLRRPHHDTTGPAPAAITAEQMFRDCDMGRVDDNPSHVSTWLSAILPLARIVACRQRNFDLFRRAFTDVRGARPLFDRAPEPMAPYVFPLWVEDADRVFAMLRARSLPVLRWDRTWPGTPSPPDDVGIGWSRHVLQLVCHQDLSRLDIAATIAHAMAALATPSA